MGRASISINVFEKGSKNTNYTLESDAHGDMTAESLAKHLVDSQVSIARFVLAEELSNGFDPEYLTYVDGNPRKPLELVNPIGKIHFVAKAGSYEMLLDIYTKIVELSPVLIGQYLDSNIVMLNNTMVASSYTALYDYFKTSPKFADGDRIRFVNLAPYARKLERLGVIYGKKKTKFYKRHDKRLGSGPIMMPNGVYVRTYNAMKGKYGKNSNLSFSFIEGKDLPNNTSRHVYKTKSGVESRIGRPYFYPSILIKIQTAGLRQVGEYVQ
jgi:hypothetical protein